MNPITSLINRLKGSTAVQRVSHAAGTLARGFDIGKSGRRLAAIPSNAAEINALIKRYGRATVARSRYLCKNNPYAAAAKATYVSALAGFGIKPSPLKRTPEEKEALQDLWNDWLPYADADGVQDHYGQQAMVGGELFEAGEIFGVFEEPRNAARLAGEGIVPLKVRLLQSEMLPLADNRPRYGKDGNYVEMGVEFNSSGERVAYHFYKRLPGQDLAANYVQERIPAERVIHVFNAVTPGQVRGIPRTLAGMVTLAMLDLYDDAELERKRTAALFAAFVTREAGDDTGDSALGTLVTQNGEDHASVSLEPGAVVDLEEGESVEFAEPADVGGQYEAFQYRMLLRAAAGFGVPYTSFTGDLKAANYSSIRAGLVEFRRRITAEQFNIMVFQFCRPIRAEWMNAAARFNLLPWGPADYLANRIKYLRTKWLAPKWDWVDPYKDAQAEKILVDNGFKDRSDVIEEGGEDPEATDRRILETRKRVLAAEDELGGAPLFADSNQATPEPVAEEGDDDGSLTDEINAYGVAVRAGSVTPQSQDEEHLREVMGLPPMSAEAKAAWSKSGNVRTPITLSKPDAVEPPDPNAAPPNGPNPPEE